MVWRTRLPFSGVELVQLRMHIEQHCLHVCNVHTFHESQCCVPSRCSTLGGGIVSRMMDHCRQLRWAQPGQQRHKNIAKKVECACTAALSVIPLF